MLLIGNESLLDDTVVVDLDLGCHLRFVIFMLRVFETPCIEVPNRENFVAHHFPNLIALVYLVNFKFVGICLLVLAFYE